MESRRRLWKVSLLATLAVVGSSSVVWAGLAAAAQSAPPATVVPNSTPSGAAAFEGPVRTIRAGAITFGYRQFGRGRPVVLVMGTNGMMSYWPWQLMEKLVAAGFFVTEFDNQGIGYSSDTPQVALTVQGMARNDIGLIRALGLKRPTVIGWSMGGEIALSMATVFGNEIGTVISSGGDVGSSHYVKGLAKNLDVFFHGSLPQVAALVFSPPGQRSQGALLSWVDSIALFPAQVPTAQIEARQEASFTRLQHSNQVWDLLPTIRNKVIVTNGAEDVLNPPANARVIAARIPGATALLFPDAGHAMMFQDMGRFVSTVQRYARR